MLAGGRSRRALQGGVLAALSACALLAFGAGAAQAAIVDGSPSVAVTQYSPTVSGNIGSATSGVSVTVTLVRTNPTTGFPPPPPLPTATTTATDADSVVATAPTATTDADGTWTATLPEHAPSNPNDVVGVRYAGSGAPADAAYRIDSGGLLSAGGFLGLGNVPSDGGAISIACFGCAGTSIPVHVAYADGSSHDFSAAGSGYLYGVSLVPAVGVNDVVTYDATQEITDLGGHSTAFTITVRATLPGQSAALGCSGDLATRTASCSGLPDGSYDVVRVRGAGADVIQTATATGSALKTTFASLHAGDVLKLIPHGQAVAITSVRLVALRVDGVQTTGPSLLGSTMLTITGGTCAPGTWLQASFFAAMVCPASGKVPATGLLPGGFPSTSVPSYDDLSAGSTTVTPPGFMNTSPLDGENVYGPSVVAFTDFVAGSDATVALTYGPRGGAQQAAPGDAGSAAGAQVTGLVAGTRYSAQWVATDANADTTTASTRFNDQAGAGAVAGPAGPAGAAGAAGPTGATGATGVAGPKGQRGPRGRRGLAGVGVHDVHVSCQLIRHNGSITATKCKATVALTSAQAAVAVRLSRGSKVYALGKGVAKTRHTTFALRQRHALKHGRYALAIVVTRHGRARTATSSAAVR